MTHSPLFIDFHALQTVPPSCVNRDDTGSPKTARFGGVRRARVSSQAWKKAMRDQFSTLLDEEEIGFRTKRIVSIVAEVIMHSLSDVEHDEAMRMAEAAIKATGIKLKDGASAYLLFVTPRQARALAELAIEAKSEDKKIEAKQAKTVLNVKERPTLNAIDVALFGRMVADAAELNVDAAVQVAHALGVTASETEFDYYTAMDDLAPEEKTGADMIGTVEFYSDTLYRYATMDVYHLYENLGSVKATVKAVGAFFEAFVRSMPTGKQNTFANRTLPDAVVVQLRDSQPVSLVGAFEKPVYPTGELSVSECACLRLAEQSRAIDEAFGTKPIDTVLVCARPAAQENLASIAGAPHSLADAISHIESDAESYLRGLGLVEDC